MAMTERSKCSNGCLLSIADMRIQCCDLRHSFYFLAAEMDVHYLPQKRQSGFAKKR
jgi:hypothetical protein